MSTIAMVFPGQGSQRIGMLLELAQQYPLVEATFAEVSSRVGYDVWQLVQQGPETQLNQTEFTQVAMLTADVAVYRVMQAVSPLSISMMAGHSLGEYAALVCAGAIDLADAAVLVAKRGELMQATVPINQGAMAAIIGLTDDVVLSICQQVSNQDERVDPANFNAVGQVVIAGHYAAVNKAIELASQSGAMLAKLIPVSVPCHCPLLLKAAELFEEHLTNTPFKLPSLPVISNVDLSVYTSVEQIKRLLQQQLYQPVRWVETIQAMKQAGVDVVIECGPGKVLSGLVKRIDKSLRALTINDPLSVLSLKGEIGE